jgi:hypothetical protein
MGMIRVPTDWTERWVSTQHRFYVSEPLWLNLKTAPASALADALARFVDEDDNPFDPECAGCRGDCACCEGR